MTLADLLRALLRRWPIVLVGLVVTVAAALAVARTEPAYHARAEVVFLAPPSARNPNELVTQGGSLIDTAGAVAARLNGAAERLKFGSPAVNPVGAPDMRDSTWIKLLDSGNQWVSVFDDQVLQIDAAARTREGAAAQVRAAAARIDAELAALQSEQNVDPIDEIRTRMSPDTPIVTEIDGSAPRAAGMTLVLGGLATVAVVVFLEVRSRARDGAPVHPHLRRLTRGRRS